MNNVRTVSDTKRAFYSFHTRPINTIYRRVVEELMVEMHLLSVNVDFTYNPIYALGVVTTFERFMQGYQPQRDKEAIFNALCQALESDPQKYRQDAEQLTTFAQSLTPEDLIAWLSGTNTSSNANELQSQIQALINSPQFKYNRLFAIGLYTLLELTDPELVKDDKRRTEALKQISAATHLSEDKIQKDLDLYRSNLDKMNQALTVMADMLSAERKKRQQRSQAPGAAANAPNEGTSPAPQDKASSGS